MPHPEILLHPLAVAFVLALSIGPSLCTAPQPLITAAPDLVRRQQSTLDYPSCTGVNNILNSCASASPDFYSLPFQSQLSCYCYTSATWAGSIYDSYLDGCLEYLSTSAPSIYTSISGPLYTGVFSTPCAAFAPAATNHATDCLAWGSIEASCSAETSGLSLLPFSSQASCLCYSGSSYAPSLFDNAWDGCLSYYSTASPAYFSSVSGAQVNPTPCAQEGDVRNSASAAASAAASTGATTGGTITSSPSSGSTATATGAQSTTATKNGATAWKAESLTRAVPVVMALGVFFL